MSMNAGEDLTAVQWRSVEWVMAFGALTPQTVMDYFAQSPFYDPTSNNAVLRMQTQYSMEGAASFNEAEDLKRFVGIEFAVVHSEPPDLFVIHKRDRISPTEVKIISCYYVLNNSVYQAPDLYTVLSNRLLSSLFYMQSSLATARDKKSDFAPRTGGNRYKVVKPETPAIADKLGSSELSNELDQHAEKLVGVKSIAATKKSTVNLDFLLARALQTTVKTAQNSQQP